MASPSAQKDAASTRALQGDPGGSRALDTQLWQPKPGCSVMLRIRCVAGLGLFVSLAPNPMPRTFAAAGPTAG